MLLFYCSHVVCIYSSSFFSSLQSRGGNESARNLVSRAFLLQRHNHPNPSDSRAPAVVPIPQITSLSIPTPASSLIQSSSSAHSAPPESLTPRPQQGTQLTALQALRSDQAGHGGVIMQAERKRRCGNAHQRSLHLAGLSMRPALCCAWISSAGTWYYLFYYVVVSSTSHTDCACIHLLLP